MVNSGFFPFDFQPAIQFKRLDTNLPLPRYESDGAAGLDLRASLNASVIIPAGDQLTVGVGFLIAIPRGYEGQVRGRSGLAARYGISVVNAPGTIDSDYRGEIKVILRNNGRESFKIEPGDRIAQLVIAKAPQHPIIEVDELPETTRGEGGFGSTGVK